MKHRREIDVLWPEFSQRGVRRVLSTGRGLWVAWEERNGLGGISEGECWVSGCVTGQADRGREGGKLMLDTGPFWAH